jgi:hypothetical protein
MLECLVIVMIEVDEFRMVNLYIEIPKEKITSGQMTVYEMSI